MHITLHLLNLFLKEWQTHFILQKENNRNGTFISSIKDIEKNLWTWYLYQTFMDIYIIDVTLVKVFKSSVRFTEVGRVEITGMGKKS